MKNYQINGTQQHGTVNICGNIVNITVPDNEKNKREIKRLKKKIQILKRIIDSRDKLIKTMKKRILTL